MLIKDADTELKLQVEDKTPDGVQGAGDFALRAIVSIRIGGKITPGEFNGNARSWIDIEKFKEFLRQLEALEASRKGFAEIESMSPGEFRIRFDAKDSRGGIVAEGEVGQYIPLSKRMNKIYFDLAIDPSLLKSLLNDFKKLSSL